MTDRIDKFLAELDEAIDAEERHRRRTPLLEAAARHSLRLAEVLDDLERSGWTAAAVANDDIRALHNEVSRASGDHLSPLIERARALLKVVEDGIVDGDPDRLRASLERAQSLVRSPAKSGGKDQPHLANPIRVVCRTCDTVVVGRRREGALNWSAVTKTLRDHERESHGGYSDEVREELRRALDRIRADEGEVPAGRYVLHQVYQ